MKRLAFIAAVLTLCGQAWAQGTSPNPPGPIVQAAPYLSTPATSNCPTAGITCGYQQFSPATAQGLPNIPQNANYALMVCQTQTVNWTDDGKTTPTASLGMPLTTNTPFIFAEHPLSLVQIIQATATATCNVSYYQ